MECPHCLTKIFYSRSMQRIDEEWSIEHGECPACGKRIIYLVQNFLGKDYAFPKQQFLVHPKKISRTPLSPDIPKEFTKDYEEACLVLFDSPKASAALSRRCLQYLLREKAKVKKSDLYKEIDEVLASNQLPSYLADGIDAVRNIGNFAAHPIKSTNTGEIVEVEPGEAEWLLDILEGLFDFYFVQPAILQKKKDALNKKLSDANKPPMQ